MEAYHATGDERHRRTTERTAPYTATAYRSKHVGYVYDTSPYPG